MVSIRRIACWALVVGMVPTGLACIGGERDAPEWDLTSARAPSSSSSGISSSGTGGSGGSSSGTAGGGGSGTGGSGGTAPTCDGTTDCGSCLICAINDPCQVLWDDCLLDANCAAHADCESLCATNFVGNPTGFAACSDDCLLTFPTSPFLLSVACACDQECAQDCAAEQPYHCANFFP